MFDAITIKSKETDDLAINPGFLAECLLFYNSVTLLAHKESLIDLFRLCGIDGVIELLKTNRLNLSIKKDNIGTAIFNTDGETYDVRNFSDTKFDKEKYITEQLCQIYSSAEIKPHLNLLMDFIKVQTYDETIVDEINEDLSDEAFLSKSLIETIRFWHPDSTIADDVRARYFQVGEWAHLRAIDLRRILTYRGIQEFHHMALY